MIKKILTYYTTRLDEYLQRKFHQPEGVAEVGFIGNSSEEKPGKLIVSLINIERETAGGIAMSIQKNKEEYIRTSPPLLLNLNVIFAAIYDEKHYRDSISVLSETLTFIQSFSAFELNGQLYTVEIVTLTLQDVNNVWTTFGGQYYPSVVCKFRRLNIDAGKIANSGKTVTKPRTNIKKETK